MRKLFEMLERIYGTPIKLSPKLDAKVKHKETVITILRGNE